MTNVGYRLHMQAVPYFQMTDEVRWVRDVCMHTFIIIVLAGIHRLTITNSVRSKQKLVPTKARSKTEQP